MSDFESLIFYCCFFTLSAILYYFGNKKNLKILKIFALLIPILIGGFRYQVGTDYINYVTIYNNYNNYSFGQYISKSGIFEILFFTIVKFCHLFNNGSQMLFFIINFLCTIICYKAIEKSQLNNKHVIWFAFLFINFCTFWNIMRQGVAVSITIFIYSLITNKEYKKAKIYSFLPMLFHKSGVICIFITFFICYLFKMKKMKLSKIIFLSLLFFFAMIILLNYVDKIPFLIDYESYVNNRVIGNNYSFYLNLFIFLTMSLYFRKTTEKNKSIILLYMLFAFELVITTVGFYSAFIKRISLYFSFGQIALLGQFFDLFNNKQTNKVLHILIIIYIYAYFIVSFYLLRQSKIFPYNSIFGI